jgi:hypothetical protein
VLQLPEHGQADDDVRCQDERRSDHQVRVSANGAFDSTRA